MASMEQTIPKDSTTFPPGYGDFALQSSDGVICHFPRYLLAYMSGFFKDLFDLPNSDTGSTPLLLTEPSQTVELLLSHMDPKTRVQSINPYTIVDLLEAARKYQVPTVSEWFEDEVEHKRVPLGSDVSVTNLLLDDPLLTLHCAWRFNLPNTGQLALREFTRCDAQLLNSSRDDLAIRVYLTALRLRKARIEQFMGFVTGLQATRLDSTGSYMDLRTVCVRCTAIRIQWVVSLQSAIREKPTWASFAAAYGAVGRGSECKPCKTNSWPDYFRDKLPDWRAKVDTLDKVLPDWPF